MLVDGRHGRLADSGRDGKFIHSFAAVKTGSGRGSCGWDADGALFLPQLVTLVNTGTAQNQSPAACARPRAQQYG